MRNPWGQTEFHGKYNEDDLEIWKNDELRELVGYVKADDGIFFMTISELKSNMDIICCCMERESYKI